VFVSSNADKPNANVAFYRIDTSAQPTRFVSGIAVDPNDLNHAFISYSGYNAYATATGTATGHVFDVHYNASGHTATFTNIDGDLGDQPITGIAFDSATGNLFVSTDFGVLARSGSSWVPAASGLPPVAIYGLTFDSVNRVLYAATHGRSAYRLSVP
jgi:WD40 repeat protein